ncbi:MAG: TetR/AcrR family transcriptional regulator [Burkholderiales bacterium]|nr:TetR/AcrR family transcriptional regulator [Burkholderiales bacterium]
MTSQRSKTSATAKPGTAARRGRKTATLAAVTAPALAKAQPRPLSPVLAAAAELLDEKGFEGLSTTAVAHRAQVSTATIYRDYPDKLAILRALIVHVTLSRHDFLAESFSRIAGAPDWRTPLAETLRKAFYLRMNAPGGGSTRRALQLSPELWLWDQKHTEQLAEDCARFIRKRKPSMTPATAKRLTLTGITAAVALLDFASLMPARNAKLIVEECIAMCEAYLAPHLD